MKIATVAHDTAWKDIDKNFELSEGQVTSSPTASSHEVENIGSSEVQTIQVEMKERK